LDQCPTHPDALVGLDTLTQLRDRDVGLRLDHRQQVGPDLIRYPAPNAEPQLHQTLPVPAANMLLPHFPHIFPTDTEAGRNNPTASFPALIGFQYPQTQIVRIRSPHSYPTADILTRQSNYKSISIPRV
jgi:hypothetical protein